MTGSRLVHKCLRLEPELNASIQHEADRQHVTWSALVKHTLKREYGLLRTIEKKARKR